MSDKRRKARVQGGWSSHGAASNARSDRHKPKIPDPPAWLTKNADITSVPKFVYEEVEDVRQKPKEKVIEKPGVYDLSSTVNGVSRLRFFHGFLDDTESSALFDEIFHVLPWRQRSDVKDGQTYLQPRLTAWYGQHGYAYSGVRHEANPQMPAALERIQARLEENTGLQFNSVLANLYRDGHDSVAWHADDEPALGRNPVIASVSLGDTRMFEMRQRPPADQDPTDYTYSEHVRLPLVNGSLLIMEGATQSDWQHRVPREYHDRGPRINLTFRVIYPE